MIGDGYAADSTHQSKTLYRRSARRLCQREPQTVLHLFKAARTLHKMCEVGFAVNPAQRQQVAGFVVESILNCHGGAIARAFCSEPDARVGIAIRVTYQVDRVVKFGFEPGLRFTQFAIQLSLADLRE